MMLDLWCWRISSLCSAYERCRDDTSCRGQIHETPSNGNDAVVRSVWGEGTVSQVDVVVVGFQRRIRRVCVRGQQLVWISACLLVHHSPSARTPTPSRDTAQDVVGAVRLLLVAATAISQV